MDVFVFQKSCAAPLFGVGTAAQARHFLAYLNDSTATIDPYLVRKPTPDEAAGIQAGELQTFDIGAEIGRIERRDATQAELTRKY